MNAEIRLNPVVFPILACIWPIYCMGKYCFIYVCDITSQNIFKSVKSCSRYTHSSDQMRTYF